MRSLPGFLLVARLVRLAAGPETATILPVAARDGRRAALSAVAGKSVGVLRVTGSIMIGLEARLALEPR